jgi:hypothetical protein
MDLSPRPVRRKKVRILRTSFIYKPRTEIHVSSISEERGVRILRQKWVLVSSIEVSMIPVEKVILPRVRIREQNFRNLEITFSEI